MFSPCADTPSSPLNVTPPSLAEALERLGLSEYLGTLTDNGFSTWETVLDITEDDLTALNFKLGHRRTLQREIASFRGIPSSLSLETDGTSTGPSSLSTSALETLSRSTSAPSREKRRYRRHPRPDNNAPKKPKTAYVNFADHLRTDPAISSLSFVDIAKEVGRRWQHLPADKKRMWESQAARAMQEYEAQMDEYKKTDLWRKYHAYLEEFKAQQAQAKNGKRVNGMVANSLARNGYSRASSSSSDSPVSIPSSGSTRTEAELCHGSLTLALSELVSLRGEILGQGVRPYDEQHLPAEELTRRAMYAFVRGTGSLLYMWTYTQVDEILDRIYRPEKPVDAMTFAECFTVAAMGAHYDLDCFPDRIRRALYASGTLHFHEKTARIDYLRTMRLLLSMSFYALLEKHMSARYLVAAGLQIARWKCPPPQQSALDTANESWRRIFRSLIFMDSWLSYTLGYVSEVVPDDIAVACTSRQPDIATMDELIHIQTSKIGLIAAEIAKTLVSAELATRENIDMLNRKLEVWRMEVPTMLQISVMTSDNPPELTLYQRRAILMVHIMYLGAVLLLHRQLLIAAAQTQLTDGALWNFDLSVDEVARYRNECAMAAQQMARILSLISFDGTFTRRCWLIIYWAFTACIVLLFAAATRLLDGQPDGVDEDLTYAKGCLDMLEPCRNYEPVAERYLEILWPLYDSLRDIHQRMLGRAKTSIFSLLQSTNPAQLSPPIPVSKEEMGPISEKLSVLLADPFGRKQAMPGDTRRRILSTDGSSLVFWFR
ncbi:uncharacterized protein BDR25DRAFT_213998 [Lindgomyces ingoldianus]|uniref:Uncharacterized protein n=1 Tax=Lindgomyces ingoldianus TaxID=673940 RepID=A0ACB6R8C5_9PLEO|nr:uncharacterized protein BDR25DRAFT_213998 [Lindgomyces ingoldianus]KAF2475563.1 hypothetical protein BDR25DRAFT_213998 [Lindgomyces ingoldianus]